MRKAQPQGGESGLGNSPVSTIRSRALAASTRGTADGLRWRIKLKPDVKWHDGAHLTAEDGEDRRHGPADAGRRSTIVTSQLPLSAWHEVIGDPTYAGACLDCLVHNARHIELSGESLRRTRGRQLKTA